MKCNESQEKTKSKIIESDNVKRVNTKMKMPDYLYRFGVGIIMVNKDKKIFIGKRVDNKSDSWQMPQGGLDDGESEDLALYRELREETGVDKEYVKLIKKSNGYHYYNLPYNLQKKFWNGKYLGQKQRWYLLEYLHDDSSININLDTPEFSCWKWADKEFVLNSIVAFKRKLYKEVLEEFREYL